MTVLEQINATLRSRKFWALVLSLVGIWSEYLVAPAPDALARAINLSVAALSVYALGVAIEGTKPDAPVSTGLEGPKQPNVS